MKTGLLLLALFGCYVALGTFLLPDTYTSTALFWILAAGFFLNLAGCSAGQLIRLCKGWQCWSPSLRLRRTTLLGLHLGLVLLLCGGLGGLGKSFQRFALYEGDSVELGPLSGGRLTGSLRLTDFSMELDQAGIPLQYAAGLQLGAEAYEVSVNRPARLGACKLYYCEYVDGFDLAILDNGLLREENLGAGDGVSFSASPKTLKILRYVPDYSPDTWQDSLSRYGNDPRVVFSQGGGGETELLAAAPGDWVRIDETAYICVKRVRPYVVLALKDDPGGGVAAMGSLLLLAGAGTLLLIKKEGA